jgi:NAD(P)-dependent dehydrogenase (short-subunit alcohol dehydrogenase family)
MRSLQGAVVAITGASAGIGRECAVAFAREGARVALAARRLERLEAVAEAVRVAGSDAFLMVTDVSRGDDVRRFIEGTLARFGRLDVLVNNAGFGVRGTVALTPIGSYERLMAVNFMGGVHACQAALPAMRRQKSGVIINVSSIVGHRALPGGGAYAATKAAQLRLTESLRVELRGTGVHACSVHPIGTETEFGEVADRESGVAGEAAPIGPQQSAAAVARAIVACAKKPRPEVYPYRPSRVLVWLNALAPSLADWLSYRAAVRSGRL